MRVQADNIEFGIQIVFVVAHHSEAVRAVKTRMNTLIVVLSESVIWYEYGMHPKSDKAQSRGDETERDSSSTGGMRDTQGSRKGEEEKAGFWLVKRKEWKTAYNSDGKSVSINIGVMGGSADPGDERFVT
jgi:ribosomal protein L19E